MKVGRARTLSALLVLVAAAVDVYAQTPTVPLSRDTGPSIRSFLTTVERLGKQQQPQLKASLEAARRSFVVVLVPGILGSSLHDRAHGEIWGTASITPAKLALDPALIDHTQASGVTAEIIRSLGPLDFYGDAIDKAGAKLQGYGVQLITCGYDWRRDIRSGARDLKDCLDRKLQHSPGRRLVFISHSMGGVVTWQWEKEHRAGHYNPQHTVAGITILGSPLAGSCEMLRMVHAGYVQPIRNTLIPHTKKLKAKLDSYERVWSSWMNVLTAAVSDQLRPVILTWPGAWN